MRHGDGFGPRSRGEIDRALQYAGEASGLKYAVVVRSEGGGSAPPTTVGTSPARPDTGTWARAVHAAMEDPRRSVLVAVDPAARSMQIVTGERSGRRLTDETLEDIVSLMAQLFATRGLVPGLVTGLQELGQRAGPPRRHPVATA